MSLSYITPVMSYNILHWTYGDMHTCILFQLQFTNSDHTLLRPASFTISPIEVCTPQLKVTQHTVCSLVITISVNLNSVYILEYRIICADQ